jgi:hypothetical protein
MGRSVLEGQVPYVEVWDHKPIGMSMLFALAQLLFSKSVMSIRILGCIAVSITSYLLYLLGRVIGKDERVGLLSGILYIAYSSSCLWDQGLATNVEIMFAPFITAAFYLYFSANMNEGVSFFRNSLRFLLIGLLFGIALQIKYSVIFDFAALFAIIGINQYLLNKKSMKSLFANISKYYILLIIGSALIFSIVFLYFLIKGHMHDFIYANFTANKIYLSTLHFSLKYFMFTLFSHITDNILLWLCLFLVPFYLFFFRDFIQEQKKNMLFLILWFFGSFFCVSISRQFFFHYFLQLLPSLCLIGSCVVITIVFKRSGMDIVRQRFVMLLILVSLSFIALSSIRQSIQFIYYGYIGDVEWKEDKDTVAVISDYLQKKVKKDDYIYVADYDDPMIYYLVQAKIPTKYAFPPFLAWKYHSRIIETDPIKELGSIMQKKPVYVIKHQKKIRWMEHLDNNFITALNNYLQNYYILDTSIGYIDLYRLKS